MLRFPTNSMCNRRTLALLLLLTLGLTFPFSARGDNKKKKSAASTADTGPRKYPFDPTKMVWPSPPNIARVHWADYFAGAIIDFTTAGSSKSQAILMELLAGEQPNSEKFNPKTYPVQIIAPYGIAIDSKVLVYVADQRVGAI